jgi:outer membrane lipoprotein SlyB
MQNAIFSLFTAFVLMFGGSAAHAQFFGWGGGDYNGPNTGSDYRGGEARHRQAVQLGTIVDIREVRVSSRRQGGAGEFIGAGLGAALGALAGQRVGEGTGQQAAQLVLGALGAWGGSRAAEAIDTVEETALEIVVEFPNGEMVAVTQAVDSQAASLHVGETVRLVDGQLTRVARHRSAARPVQPQMQQQGGGQVGYF